MPITPTDSRRSLKIESPLGEDLICRSLNGQESLGRLFDYQLELLSLNRNVQFQDIVGQRVTVSMEVEKGERYFDGYVTEFRYMGTSGQFARYQAILKPWFWFLTRTSDCRIFQNQKVPDIIKSVFRDNGMSDFKDQLSDSYRDWVYCVQYRETDFNFISRLMEQEGIYYYFEHEDGKHTLVLADGVGAHQTFPEYETVPYFPADDSSGHRKRDHIQDLVVSQAIVPGKYAIKDFDFEKPKVDLTTKLSETPVHAYPIDDHEIYDYPGEYSEVDDGDTYVKKKLEELKAQHERVQLSGSARGLCAGSLFTLDNYPRADQNKEYLIVSVSHDITADVMETSGGSGAEDFYSCVAEVFDSSQQYRSERLTPKPIVQGPQTAIVVGPSGDEIYCDKYARVKVQFHWDRYGKNDQNSSCWVRVSQAWAGKSWGGIHIPRIGQEVLISFLEGDPDQPLITGRVYNAINMPPYGLEANKTQSGIKSRSSKGGTPDNFNELRMEDKKGSEELYIQAEKDENILVKNDKGETVGHNETISIGNDREELVGNNETLTVAVNRTRNVGSNESVTVAKMRTHTVGINEAIAIGAAQEIVVGANQSTAVGANQSDTVGISQSVEVGKNRSLSVGKNLSVSTGDNESRSVGKNLAIDAGDSITLKCGAASISMKKNGDIMIKGKNLILKASSKVNVKASSTVTIKGSKILEN
jgi:type VI secretion system secreted protein VgrG